LVENFASGTAGFGGGSTSYTNPGTGGVDGVGDGFLRIFNTAPSHFGTRVLSGPFTGDYVAANITHVRFWLNDVETDQAFEITFAIGSDLNLWRWNTPFLPPHQTWQQYEVDLRDPGQFTRARGTGTYEEALAGVTRLHLRHDLQPYILSPDGIAGQLGVDKVELASITPVPGGTWGQIKHLFR
jgi:hypothetical protein